MTARTIIDHPQLVVFEGREGLLIWAQDGALSGQQVAAILSGYFITRRGQGRDLGNGWREYRGVRESGFAGTNGSFGDY